MHWIYFQKRIENPSYNNSKNYLNFNFSNTNVQKAKQFSVGDQVPFYSIKLDETNVLKIINVIDSNNNNYYEVDYLASQDASVALRNVLKKKSANTKKFHRLLNAKPHLKKLYEKIKAKLGK